MCRLAEVRDSIMPIITEMKNARIFDQTMGYSIGNPENNEHLYLLLRKDNHRNEVTAIILFERINLEIQSSNTILDFEIELKLGNNNHISIYDLEIILLPNDFLQEHSESEIAKDVISCWNA